MLKTEVCSETLRIYYNPRCSKCREVLSIVEKHGYTAALVKYLDNPPDKKELKDILRKLGMQPQQLLRTGESVYKQHYATLALSDDAWLDAMVLTPC